MAASEEAPRSDAALPRSPARVTGNAAISRQCVPRCVPVAAGVAISLLLMTGQAHAHGFGARSDLPIPLSLYLAGAGLTVAVSFAMLATCMRSAPVSDEYGRINLRRSACGRPLVAPGLLLACRALAVALFLLVV